jgi:hypothetical protein
VLPKLQQLVRQQFGCAFPHPAGPPGAGLAVALPPAPETVVESPFASPEALDVVLVVELVLPPVSPPRAPSPPVVVDALLI